MNNMQHPKSKWCEPGSSAPFGTQEDRHLDCADTTTERKPLATLRARLTLAGWVLTATPDNPRAFTVSRWGMAREFHELAAVAAFADRVGAPS